MSKNVQNKYCGSKNESENKFEFHFLSRIPLKKAFMLI